MLNRNNPFALVLALALNAAYGAPDLMPQLITLERNCNGCTRGSRLVLHADGRAELTRVGNARMGTVDERCEGRFSPAAFEAVAALARGEAFQALGEDLADPEVQDGPWLALRVDYADGRLKQVFQRGPQPPRVLTALVDAIDVAGRQAGFDAPRSEGEGCGLNATPR